MTASAPPPSACVLLVDANRGRQRSLSTVFRAAGCVVLEASQEHEVKSTLSARAKPWVLAVAGSALTLSFRDAHPSVPIIQIGCPHREAIAGRMTIDTSPQLSSQVHALVAGRN